MKVGVTAERVLTASITLPVARYPSDRVGPFLANLLQRLEAIPGVVAAATTNSVPPDGLSMTDNFVVEDRLPPAGRAAPVGPLLDRQPRLSADARYFPRPRPLVRRVRYGVVNASRGHQ